MRDPTQEGDTALTWITLIVALCLFGACIYVIMVIITALKLILT